MTKRFFAILRYSSVVALMASLFVLSGCGSDDDGPTAFSGTTLEFLKQDKFKQASNGGDADNSFDSLVMYLDKFPELETYLTGTAEFTLFAPSNKAFVNLTALPGLTDPDQVNPDIIKGVLAYHFVQGKKMKTDLSSGASITTLFQNPISGQFEAITVNSDGTLKTGSQNPSIQITTYDQETGNGIVHTVATVLIPVSTGGTLASILGTLGATVLLGKDFTYMAYLITIADLTAEDDDTFTGIIADKTAKLTLLAIPNPVFEMAFESTDPVTIKTAIATNFGPIARAILENHVLDEQYSVALTGEGITKFADAGAFIVAHSGNPAYITTGLTAEQCSCTTGILLSQPQTGSETLSNAPILIPDISSEVGISNGILQVVGGIFLP